MVPFVILAIEDPVKRARYQDAYLTLNQHLIAVAMSLLNDKQSAEDALQDAFEAIIDADILPEDDLGQKALLTTVVKRKALDILKHKRFLADDEPSEDQLGFTFMTEKVELDTPTMSIINGTATCKAKLVFPGKTINATLELKQGGVVVDSWSNVGYGYLILSGSTNVTSGLTYTLTVYGTVDGVDLIPASINVTP